MITINFQINKVTYEMTPDNSQMIVPVVLLVEGVHTGVNNRSILYTKEELQQLPSKWNGKPVPVNHPHIQKEDGSLTYVAFKDLSEEEQSKFTIGHLSNVQYMEENGLGKLKGNIVLDLVKSEEVYKGLVARIQAGKQVEVSSGLFDTDVNIPGTWNNEAYEAIATNIRPDHLAILPNSVGACSWQDGCGIRDNQGEGGRMEKSQKEIREILEPLGLVTRGMINNSLSDQDIRMKLRSNLSKSFDSKNYDVYIRDVYQKDKYFIYERAQYSSTGGISSPYKLYKRSFSLKGNAVEIGDEETEVEEITKYEEVKTNQQGSSPPIGEGNQSNKQPEKEGKMDKKNIVDSIITNASSGYTEENREYLMGLEECPLNKIKAMSDKIQEQEEKIKANQATDPPQAPPVKKLEENQVLNTTTPKLVTMESYINDAPPEVREILNDAVVARSQRRTELIETIKANSANPFSDEWLNKAETTTLEGIVFMTEKKQADQHPPVFNSNYFGRGGGPAPSQKKEELPVLDVLNPLEAGSNNGNN